MNILNRIIVCSAFVAMLGLSGCILPGGHMGRGEDRDHHRDSRRGSHRDHDDRRGYVECDRHDKACPEPVLFAL